MYFQIADKIVCFLKLIILNAKLQFYQMLRFQKVHVLKQYI